MNGPSTFDTNVAIYAFLGEAKSEMAASVVERADLVSVQVLNEFTNVASRKFKRSWAEISIAVERLRASVSTVLPIDASAQGDAMRIAARYRLSFYDALMLAVALSGGARTFYSEDMQHGLVVDDTLRVVDPFRSEDFNA